MELILLGLFVLYVLASKRQRELGSLCNSIKLDLEAPAASVVSNSKSAKLLEDIKQKWKGTIVSVAGETFKAEIKDITNPQNPDELVTISLAEISSGDRELVKPGALFYWHIGYREGERYPRERFSSIRIRRLLNWTESEIQEAKELAEVYADLFAAN